MAGDTDLAAVGALIGDPGRARVLRALTDGRELPASVLAAEAGVAPSTASVHLRKLVDGGLVVAERHGRHRYFRLAGPDVARALEALARIAPPAPVRSLREGTRAHAVRAARTCYDHLAGRLGVALMAGFVDDGVLVGGDGRHERGARARPTARRPSAATSTTASPTAARGGCATWASTSTARSPARARRSATAWTGASRTTTSPGRWAPRWPRGCSSSNGWRGCRARAR